MISSLANPTVRRVRRLRKRMWREREGRFLVEGHRAVDAALRAGAALHELYFTAQARDLRHQTLERARAAGVPAVDVSPEVMAHLTSVVTAPDVLAIAPMRHATAVELPAVVLASVHDPATAGGILATAAACGLRTAVVPVGSVDPWSPKVARTAGGAHFVLGIARAASVQEALAAVRAVGARVVGLGTKGIPPWEADLLGPIALVVAGEEAEIHVDAWVAPPAETVTPSLAARTAVVLYEWIRQREVG